MTAKKSINLSEKNKWLKIPTTKKKFQPRRANYIREKEKKSAQPRRAFMLVMYTPFYFFLGCTLVDKEFFLTLYLYIFIIKHNNNNSNNNQIITTIITNNNNNNNNKNKYNNQIKIQSKIVLRTWVISLCYYIGISFVIRSISFIIGSTFFSTYFSWRLLPFESWTGTFVLFLILKPYLS